MRTVTLVLAAVALTLFVYLLCTLTHRALPEDSHARVITVDARDDVERTPAPTTTTTTVKPVVTVPPTPRARTAPSRRPATRTLGRCGGDLPPCSVMMRESGGNIHAYNPTGCGGRGCRGKWQCDPRTCSGTGTEAEQDAEARALWDGGRGCAHWAAC